MERDENKIKQKLKKLEEKTRRDLNERGLNSLEPRDIVLVKKDLRDVVTSIQLSRATMSKIKQGLFWAFAYNTALIPLAAGILYPFFGVLLDPVFGEAAMAFSSVSVVTNASLLRKFKPKLE